MWSLCNFTGPIVLGPLTFESWQMFIWLNEYNSSFPIKSEHRVANPRMAFFGLWRINWGKLRYPTELSGCTYLVTFSSPNTSLRQWLVDFFGFHSTVMRSWQGRAQQIGLKIGARHNYITVINGTGRSTKQSFLQCLRMKTYLIIFLTSLHHLHNVTGASFSVGCN